MRKALYVVTAVTVIGLAGSCEFFMGSKDLSGMSEKNVTLWFGSGTEASQASRSVLPGGMINSLRYEVELRGPGGQVITRSVPAGSGMVTLTLTLGEWVISARAYTPEGILAGMGTLAVTVESAGTSVMIPMKAAAFPAGYRGTETANGASFNLRYVPAGSFQRDGTPANISTITKGYWMGETEVTQELWAAVMTGSDNLTSPSGFSSGPASGEIQEKRPVETITWYDAVEFCNRLSAATGKQAVYTLTGITRSGGASGYITAATVDADWSRNGYRLPTEMEWMWAAMGATAGGPAVSATGYSKAFSGSTGSNILGDYEWYGVLYSLGGKTHETAKKLPNELGIHDMTGNVQEFCWDWYAAYESGPQINHPGPASGTIRVGRGGIWDNNVSTCTIAYRDYGAPNNRSFYGGFRVVSAP
ncbi:MAG: formylglycine-generating enzyme family protein [Treponema sp.]|jgi:formylglycine-generating enzyme required for sulfatase activity|nr:formylglycine-generating enzyme family protein [Treponema sp.]